MLPGHLLRVPPQPPHPNLGPSPPLSPGGIILLPVPQTPVRRCGKAWRNVESSQRPGWRLRGLTLARAPCSCAEALFWKNGRWMKGNGAAACSSSTSAQLSESILRAVLPKVSG